MNSLERNTDKFTSLPPVFQQAISSFDYDGRLHRVAVKHKLHIDQLVGLERAMSGIVFGDLHAEHLSSQLARDLHLDSAHAVEIAFDLNTEVLAPLKAHIKQTHDNSLE